MQLGRGTGGNNVLAAVEYQWKRAQVCATPTGAGIRADYHQTARFLSYSHRQQMIRAAAVA